MDGGGGGCGGVDGDGGGGAAPSLRLLEVAQPRRRGSFRSLPSFSLLGGWSPLPTSSIFWRVPRSLSCSAIASSSHLSERRGFLSGESDAIVSSRPGALRAVWGGLEPRRRCQPGVGTAGVEREREEEEGEPAAQEKELVAFDRADWGPETDRCGSGLCYSVSRPRSAAIERDFSRGRITDTHHFASFHPSSETRVDPREERRRWVRTRVHPQIAQPARSARATTTPPEALRCSRHWTAKAGSGSTCAHSLGGLRVGACVGRPGARPPTKSTPTTLTTVLAARPRPPPPPANADVREGDRYRWLRPHPRSPGLDRGQGAPLRPEGRRGALRGHRDDRLE